MRESNPPNGRQTAGKPVKQPKKKQRPPDAARQARQVIQRRTIYLLCVFGVLTFLAVFGKAYDLTINQADDLKQRASRQQTRSTVLSASRGTIYDRNGTILAISATADTVFLDPKAINESANKMDIDRAEKLKEGLKSGETVPMSGQEYKDLIAEKLSEILELEKDSIYEKMEKTWSQYEILKTRVDKDTVGDQVRDFISHNDTGKSIRGIYLLSDSKRYYPYSSLASHVIGFLNKENHGAYGLEAIYENALEGTKGLAVTAKDANGSELMFQYEQYYDAENGNSLVLTIDSNIQNYVERGLADMISKYGAKNGAMGIVMDPRNGAILAMASNPAYDVNNPWEVYESRLKDLIGQQKGSTAGEVYTQGDMQTRQWRNKAVNDTYEPGSTYKVLTLAMGLEEKTIGLGSSFYCSGNVTIGTDTIWCSNKNGHRNQNLKQAVGHSCNPAFISIAQSVGGEKYWDYMEAFGLFEPTGIDLNGEAAGIVISRDKFVKAPVSLASYSFGQTFNVTPIALITAQAACINGGYLYTPYLVEKELDGDGNVVRQHDATPVRQVVSGETSALVREILEYVVSDGGGANGQVTGYRIGGKTGTADKTGTGNRKLGIQGDVVVSFMSFAPADDPQVIMLLTLDTPSRNTGTYVSGGNMVAPTSSSIMSDILPYLGISPQYSEDTKASAEMTVPYVIGSTEAEAAEKLTEYGFSAYRTVGDGETVTDQTPVGGAIIPAGAEIILYMGAEKSTALCTVPNVVGMSAADANKAVTNAGLIMKSTGASGTNGVKAIGQSMEAGSEVAAGTVITVQMGQTSTTAD
ncbi:MAG: PASTA domain-containing protein [Oscillospiraceae bacterium]|nr:PASTA domain-containing protein [Oscillospiraceae bacterium]